MIGQVGALGHDAESLLAQELTMRSQVGATRRGLLDQAQAQLDKLKPEQLQLRKVLQAGQGGGAQKARYREVCLEIATLEKAIGHYH